MSSITSLFTLDATGNPVPANADEIIAAARRCLAHRVRRGSSLSSPAAMRDFLRVRLGTREFETFCILFLDSRHRLIEFVELFRGSLTGASVHPREVVKEALKRNAAAVILVHPHPSGVAEPSHADELITRRLQDALQLVEVRVLDHLIVAGDEILSFSERGDDLRGLRPPFCSPMRDQDGWRRCYFGQFRATCCQSLSMASRDCPFSIRAASALLMKLSS
jgi:DNA repair protein RadC